MAQTERHGGGGGESRGEEEEVHAGELVLYHVVAALFSSSDVGTRLRKGGREAE